MIQKNVERTSFTSSSKIVLVLIKIQKQIKRITITSEPENVMQIETF
jgi:hypothetical protein